VSLLLLIDSSISTGRSSTQGALHISIDKDIDPDSEIVWDTLSGEALSHAGTGGAYRTAFKEFWQEHVKEEERPKNSRHR
jgi:hypothetical protein